MPMSPQFHVYHDGYVRFVDTRVSKPISALEATCSLSRAFCHSRARWIGLRTCFDGLRRWLLGRFLGLRSRNTAR